MTRASYRNPQAQARRIAAVLKREPVARQTRTIATLAHVPQGDALEILQKLERARLVKRERGLWSKR